jgi:hypothetical protein
VRWSLPTGTLTPDANPPAQKLGVPVKVIGQDVPGDPKLAAPLSLGMGFASEGVPAIASRIVVLHDGERPAAVTRFVMTIVVDAIDGMLRAWPRSHVG